MIPRPYQRECLVQAPAHLAQYNTTLLVLATGLGKTVIFSLLAGKWPEKRILVIAHREELISQAAEKLALLTPHAIGIEMASKHQQGEHVVISSVQTLSRESRLACFDPHAFGLVIIDEAHHAPATTYRRVIDHFRQNAGMKVLGVTATPKRLDGLAMGQIFNSVCYEYGIEPASNDGWLVPIKQQVVKVEGLDWSEVREVAGELNAGDVEAIVTREEILHRTLKPTVDLVGDMPTLVFCNSVAHAEKSAEILNRYKSQSAEWLSGETSRDRRREVIAAFKAGKLQFLCNVSLFLEGFDAPNCAAIAMARPTKSLALYTQVIGRATRTLPGVIDGLEEDAPARRKAAIATSAKPNMLILDFAGNAGRHKIVTAADLLGGKYAPAVRDYARQTAEDEGEPVQVDMALDRADAELALIEQDRVLKARRARIKARAEFRTQEVSPFAGVASTAGSGTMTSKQGPRMLFGKHKGQMLAEIPKGYLQWVLELPKLAPWLRQAVEKELEHR